MSSWRDEYITALKARDKREKTDQELYYYYSKLADRAAGLSKVQPFKVITTLQKKGVGDDPKLASESNARVAKLQEDLTAAQRSRVQLEYRLNGVIEDLAKSNSTAKNDKKRLSQLVQERQTLITKLRDRDEELRRKTKLIEDVHDETVSLTLQLNMAESQNQKLRVENHDLVDRWMARMGQEADAMNLASRFS